MINYAMGVLIVVATILVSRKALRLVLVKANGMDAFRDMRTAIKPKYKKQPYTYSVVCNCAQCAALREGSEP